MLKPLDFSSSSVLIIGDIMIDKYWHCDVNRISPEAPVSVAHIKDEDFRIGGAGNVALNCGSLGARTRLLGLVGDDGGAETIETLLKARNVAFDLPQQVNSKTTTKLRVMSRGQQLIRLDSEDQFTAEMADCLTAVFEDALTEADIVVLSDYGKGALGASKELIAAAKAIGKITIVDPKGTDFEKYRGANYITPNLNEFEAVVGQCMNEAEIDAKGKALAKRYDFDAVLVTRGQNGMMLVPRDAPPVSFPAQTHEVYDVTGAGDTVVASFATALAFGYAPTDAVAFSNICAGIVVTKLGTAVVELSELEDSLTEARRQNTLDAGPVQLGRGKILDVEELKHVRARLKRSGKTVVMTNGCFDILHAGHVSYLAAAARLGDVLIVAVNSDSSVSALKGNERPVNPLEARLGVLAALVDVDWIVEFSEEDPDSLYRELTPDILVKGADYLGKSIAGADHVISAGGRVELIELLPGHSTTSIVEKIKENMT